MKNATLKLLALLMACLMVVSCFVACGESTDDPAGPGEGDTRKPGEGETDGADTLDEVSGALQALDEIDWGGEEFTILHTDMYQSEIWGENKVVDKENGGDQLLNDAVYQRG